MLDCQQCEGSDLLRFVEFNISSLSGGRCNVQDEIPPSNSLLSDSCLFPGLKLLCCIFF